MKKSTHLLKNCSHKHKSSLKPFDQPRNNSSEKHNERIKKAHHFRMSLLKMSYKLRSVNAEGLNSMFEEPEYQQKGEVFISKHSSNKSSQRKRFQTEVRAENPHISYESKKYINDSQSNRKLKSKSLKEAKEESFSHEHRNCSFLFKAKTKKNLLVSQQDNIYWKGVPQNLKWGSPKFRRYETEHKKEPYQKQLFYPIREMSKQGTDGYNPQNNTIEAKLKRLKELRQNEEIFNNESNYKNNKMHRKNRYRKIITGLEGQKKQISVADRNIAWAILNNKSHEHLNFSSLRDFEVLIKKSQNESQQFNFDKRKKQFASKGHMTSVHQFEGTQVNDISLKKLGRAMQHKELRNSEITPWDHELTE